MNIIVYGIPNCGSVKKARTFLEDKSLDYEFHDYKKLGVNEGKLVIWCDKFGWEHVLNRKGQTWRNLNEGIKFAVTNQQAAIKVMLENTSAIKRPIIESSKGILLGFDEEQYKSFFL